jgi:hypothetical protein
VGDELVDYGSPQRPRGQNIVECHSGYAYPERPVALCYDGVRLAVTAILTQWRTPNGRCFAVKVGDGREFVLAYNEKEDDWTITLT